MSQTRDSKGPAVLPNIQDVFLNHARRERAVVSIRLMDGSSFDGRIKSFDRFAIVIEHDGSDQMVFKHAIASIGSRAVAPDSSPDA